MGNHWGKFGSVDARSARAQFWRELVRKLFSQALNEAAIEPCIERIISCERNILRISDAHFDLDSYAHVVVVSIGKAAQTLVQALESRTRRYFEGIVCSSVAAQFENNKLKYFCGGHPTPNAASLAGADAILRFVRSLDENSLIIFMISGGGSSNRGKAVP